MIQFLCHVCICLTESGRPIFSPAQEAKELAMAKEQLALDEATERDLVSDDKKRQDRAQKGMAAAGIADDVKKAPRDDRGELILKRREVHSGRALTVSSVEWSVAENMATPSSTLEGFMWDKETEVDRFRERVPLANLASQCRLSAADPESPKPRDWVGPVRDAAARCTKFVIIPECKRFDPTTGSLRKRYDLNKLTKEFVLSGVPAISVNCDGVIFGGSLEDVTKAREASSKAALSLQTLYDDGVVVPPILASDLLLYPYQLYKMRLAGADAVNLVVGALATKDLVYLTKIAASLQLQVLVTVTSKMQVQRLTQLAAGAVDGMIVSNRIVSILTCKRAIFLGMRCTLSSCCSPKS
jgi:indole-3-glycerol phosphate synthase